MEGLQALVVASTVVVSSDGSGTGLIHQLIWVLLIGLCALIVYGMGWYFLSKLPQWPFALTVWNGFFVLVGGLIIINFILGLAGHPLVQW